VQHSFTADGEHAREDALLEAGAEHDRVVFLIHVRGPGLEEPDSKKREIEGRRASASVLHVRVSSSSRLSIARRDPPASEELEKIRGARFVRDIERRDTRRTRYNTARWKEGRPALSLSLLGVDDDGDDDGGSGGGGGDGGDSGGQAVAVMALTSLFP